MRQKGREKINRGNGANPKGRVAARPGWVYVYGRAVARTHPESFHGFFLLSFTSHGVEAA